MRPDVVMFVLILLGEVHTKSDHIWPKPIVVGPEPQAFGPDVFILKCSSWKGRRDHEHLFGFRLCVLTGHTCQVLGGGVAGPCR